MTETTASETGAGLARPGARVWEAQRTALELAALHGRKGSVHHALHRLLLDASGPWPQTPWRKGVALLAALLTSLSLLMAVAANWGVMSPMQRFVLLQVGAVAGLLVFGLWPRTRAAMGLCVFAFAGGLMALFGQTYQTGADPWQLFALWAVLTLPLAWAARSDAVWAPWVLVCVTAMLLWQYGVGPFSLFMAEWNLPLERQAMVWALAAALLVLLAPQWRRWTGAGLLSQRLAWTAFVWIVVLPASFDVWRHKASLHFALAAVLLLVAAWRVGGHRRFDGYALSWVLLGLNALLVSACGWWVDGLGIFLQLLSLVLVMVCAMTASVLLFQRQSRRARLAAHAQEAPTGPTSGKDTKAPQSPAGPAGQEGAADPTIPLRATVEARTASQTLERLQAQAVALGLLSESQALPPHPATLREWPLRLLTVLGTWFVVLPLLALVAKLFSGLYGSVFHLGLAVLGLVVSLLGLRAARGAVLPQQALMAVLLASVILMSLYVHQYGSVAATATVFALLMLLCIALLASVTDYAALRALLGAGLALGLAVALFDLLPSPHVPSDLLALALVMAGGCIGVTVFIQVGSARAGGFSARHLLALDDAVQGWLLLVLLGAAVFSSEVATDGPLIQTINAEYGPIWMQITAAGSVLMAAAALAWLLRQDPDWRQPWLMGVALVLVGLAWFVPMLGVCLLIMAVAWTQRRRIVLSCAALAACWTLIDFYYTLAMPLLHKAVLLLVLALLLWALIAWGAWGAWAQRRPHASAAQRLPLGSGLRPRGSARDARLWAAVGSLVALLVMVNQGIREKEQLIAQGVPVYVPLTPVDPRSLIQGDYMRLNFFPAEFRAESTELAEQQTQLQLVLKLDASTHIATPLRVDRGEPLQADEMRLPLTRKGSSWVLVTDAFYFEEGQAERWSRARYGEFRVDDAGRALLVTLRGENREALPPLQQ